MRKTKVLALAVLAALSAAPLAPAQAASHREAPLIALDPAADLTDVYTFVSYDNANIARLPADRRVTFIMNVNPGQNPADGPNYFNFSDDVIYQFHIDNNRDGKAEDIVYEFEFRTEDRPIGGPGGLTSPVPYLGNPDITPALPLQGITQLDGAGSEGLTRRQKYKVTEIRGGRRTVLFDDLIAVPSNVGTATMPNYESLAAQGIYSDPGRGIRVFAGQRAETFYIDLGAVFDTLNLRRSPPVPIEAGDDGDNVNPFGINRFAGANISTIAIEVPLRRVTFDGQGANPANRFIGVYASTSRQKVTVLREPKRDMSGPDTKGPLVQVARMANPLVNELIINTPFKDLWNATDPEAEARFQEFYKNPVIATALNLVFGFPILPIDGSPASARTDLMSILLKYPGQPLSGGDCGSPCAELLRLDLSVEPKTAADQSRLGAALGGDPAGFPNGRRPNDDVTDIAVRVVGGSAYIGARAGDGVNFLAGAPGAGLDQGAGNLVGTTATGIATEFPFLPTPYSGRLGFH